MRVAIEGAGDVLRRALLDLVVAAGHEVVSAAPDLEIRVGSASVGPAAPRRLWLSPPASVAPDGDPRAALERVLASGGSAIWADPFDPDLLLDGLGANRDVAAPPTLGAADALDSSPHPWLGLDPRTGAVRWANAAARAALDARLPPTGTDLAAVLSSERGRSRVGAGGRSWTATWWTDSAGTRVVGLGPPDDPVPAHVRSLAELGRTSATLAHELRNPVAAFAGALQLLAKDLSAEERSEVSALARERVSQMSRLLDDVLRLARPFKGPASPVDVALVARSAVQSVRTDPRFERIRVTMRSDDGTPRVLGYEQPLGQAVTNLLVNAAQAQDGAGPVEVSLVRRGDRALLSVADEGPGVPEALREKVFEPFWTTKPGGTGLGLAYVRRVAEACGGFARVEAAGVRGARVVLDLPTCPDE